MKNKKVYHNLETHELIYLSPNEDTPEGFLPGLGQKKKFLYHNETTSARKYFYEGDKIPAGWVTGDAGPRDNTNCVKAKKANIA